MNRWGDKINAFSQFGNNLQEFINNNKVDIISNNKRKDAFNIFKEQFTEQNSIGKGGYGEVFRVKNN